MIGPVTLVATGESYRSSFRTRAYVTPDYLPGLNAHPMKALALVEAGARVRLVVPRRQRSWMRLFYRDGDDSGQHAITLQACRRLRSEEAREEECDWEPRTACSWSNTQFGGALYVDFDNAPRAGRCAVLEVQVPGEAMTYRGRAFGPRRRECREPAVRVQPRAPRPRTVLSFSFRSPARLGTFGRRRRAYRLAVLGPAEPACASDHEAFADRGRRGQRLVVRLDPRRTKGGRWCRGRFRGRLIQFDTYGCPKQGACRRPANFISREREVARFYFTVR
jgi:hypothetical protein